ncbi:MAG: AgmX/PglI C-terminal domain-containing protein [Myxococcaceae bacterium]
MEGGQLLQLFEQGGPLAYLVALIGGVGLAFSLGVLVVLASGGRTAARLLATLGLLCAALAVSVGVAGTLLAQSRVDESLGPRMSASLRERARRVGFSEARACSKLGLVFALVPAALGAIGLIGGRPRRSLQPGGTRIGVSAANPAVGRFGAVLFVVTAGVASYAATLQRIPLPGRELEESAWQILGLYDSLASNNVSGACLRPEIDPPVDNSVAREHQALQEDCADKLLTQLEEAKDPAKARESLRTFASARWLVSKDVRARVEAKVGALPQTPKPKAPESSATLDAEVPEGAPSEDTRPDRDPADRAAAQKPIPPALVRNLLSRQGAGIKRCYKAAARKRRVSGEVRVEMVISSTGFVTSATDVGGSLHDNKLRACIVSEAKRLRFPVDEERDDARVTYPFIF